MASANTFLFKNVGKSNFYWKNHDKGPYTKVMKYQINENENR